MLLTNSEIFYHAYVAACVLGTIAMGIDCFIKNNANEDVSQSSFQHFHQDGKDNICPSVTRCVANPMLEDNFNAYRKGITIRSYSDFLR